MNGVAAHSSAISDIEGYFRQFPDVPREIIVKVELLSKGHWFTDAALKATHGSLVKSYRLFSYDLIPMDQMKRNEARQVPEWFYIFQGPYDLRAVQIQTTMDPSSPYIIDLVDGRLVLTSGGEIICNVAYPLEPKYYAKRFPDGVLYHEVCAYGYFFTVFRQCQYWGPKEECRFCDINQNARQMKESREFTLNAPVKKIEQVAEAAREVGRNMLAKEGYQAPISFLITGGTITNVLRGLDENAFYGQYVRAIKESGPRRHVSLQTNAKTKEEIKWLHNEGLDGHQANMEVWDQRLFDWINPGKARRIGHAEWIRRMLDSVDILGEGNVRPNFVGGIEMARPYGFDTVEEAVASTTEGLNVLMSHGVDPRFNQWRREPKSNLVQEHEQPPVPTEFYIRLMSNRYELWKKYGLQLPAKADFNETRRYLGVGHGTYDDFPLLMEAPWYQDAKARTPEELVQLAGGWTEPRQVSIHRVDLSAAPEILQSVGESKTASGEERARPH
jgi:hypothetical protein